MNVADILEREKVVYELWRSLAGRVKESQWEEVANWLEEDFPHRPEEIKREILWLVKTLR